MSKASYRARESGFIGFISDQVPHPKRKITLKAYRKGRRARHREAKKLWKRSIDAWSMIPSVEGKEGDR